MFKKKKLLSLTLIGMIAASLLTGCGETEEVVEQITFPKTTLMQDEYDREDYIDGFLTYNVDYITQTNGRKEKLTVETLFNHPQIQVDDWGSITVGVTTMGEIVEYIDSSNTYFVESNTQAVIDARQKEIDDEYNEAKAKAEAKGKEYTKPKKTVRTDDIKFTEPYQYQVFLENTPGKDKKDQVPGWTEEYKPTLLVDSLKSQLIILQVYKYGIPYIDFEFKSVEGVYNPGIIQESDWICNGITAADVSAYVNKDGNGNILNMADFVDEDLKNKGAKKNIYMTGDISFSGDGITWESLRDLCTAMKLNFMRNEKKKDVHSYEQYSEQEFMYYTIEYLANPFELNPNLDQALVTFPMVQLEARFNPLSQVCVDWSINTYNGSKIYEDGKHELSKETYVGVTQHKVDTKDYEGMRLAVQNWIDTNSLPYKTAYCATDNSNIKAPVTYIIDTGKKNLFIEPMINGVQYTCVGKETNEYGETVGSYIPTEIAEQAAGMSQADAEYLKYQNTSHFVIECCLVDDSGLVIEKINEETLTIIERENEYVLLSYEDTDLGLENLRFIEKDRVEEYLDAYIRIYELNTAQSEELKAAYAKNQCDGVKTYIDGLFAEAERAKNALLGIEEKTEENYDTSHMKYIDNMSANSKADISKLTIDGSQLNINELTTAKLKELGLESDQTEVVVIGDVYDFAGFGYGYAVEPIVEVTTENPEELKAEIIENEELEVDSADVEEAAKSTEMVAEEVVELTSTTETEETVVEGLAATEAEIEPNIVDQTISTTETSRDNEAVVDEVALYVEANENEEVEIIMLQEPGIVVSGNLNGLEVGMSSIDALLNVSNYFGSIDDLAIFDTVNNSVKAETEGVTSEIEITEETPVEENNEPIEELVATVNFAEKLKLVEENCDIKLYEDSYIIAKNSTNAVICELSEDKATITSIVLIAEKGFNHPILIEETEDEEVEDFDETIVAEEETEEDAKTTATISLGLLVIVGLIVLVLLLATIIPSMIVYKELGEPGWAAIVPLYSQMILAKHTLGNPLFGLLVLFVGPVILCVMYYKLFKQLKQSTGFAILGALLTPVALLIYVLKKKSDIVDEDDDDMKPMFNNYEDEEDEPRFPSYSNDDIDLNETF